MEILGLIFEILFLGLGVYIYLFVRGFIKYKDSETKAKADTFRKENGWWLRLMAIALMAIMTINIILHIQDFLK